MPSVCSPKRKERGERKEVHPVYLQPCQHGNQQARQPASSLTCLPASMKAYSGDQNSPLRSPSLMPGVRCLAPLVACNGRVSRGSGDLRPGARRADLRAGQPGAQPSHGHPPNPFHPKRASVGGATKVECWVGGLWDSRCVRVSAFVQSSPSCPSHFMSFSMCIRLGLFFVSRMPQAFGF